MTNFKWRTILGLALIYLTVFLYPNYQWIWAILFLYWVIPDLFTRTTYFIEPIHRNENAIVYWLIVVTWLALSVYILVEAFL